MLVFSELLTYGIPDKNDLRRKAKACGFSQIWQLEHLWWDYEFAAQLQQLDKTFLLKGGAATQLFLDRSLQRGSLDVDLVTPLNAEQVQKAVTQLEKKFDGSPIDVKKYVAKKPIEGLPLITYHVGYRELEGGGPNHIKLEIFSSDIRFPSTKIESKETLALTVRDAICISRGSLSGDKLTTLASGPVGAPLEEQPKQLYDIDHLIFSIDFGNEAVLHLMEAFQARALEELGFKKLKGNPRVVLADIIDTLTKFSKANTIGDQAVRKAIRDFETNYVSTSARTSQSGWGVRALRVRFLATTMKLKLEDKLTQAEMNKLLT